MLVKCSGRAIVWAVVEASRRIRVSMASRRAACRKAFLAQGRGRPS